MKGGFLLGVTVGASLGVTLGLMLAPKSGAETRAQVGEALGKLKEAAAERARSGIVVLLMPVSVSISTSNG